MPLNILTWNVKHSTPHDELILHLRQLVEDHNVDVVCLQEICLASTRHGLTHLPRRLAAATGMSALTVPHPVPNGSWWEGLVILSRHEIANPARHLLSVHRSYLFAVILHPQLPWLRVGNLHVSAFTKEWREREVRRALRLHPPSSALVCGDFNLTPEELAMREAAASYQVDGSGPTCGRRKIDYVLAGPELNVLSSCTLDAGPSDHRPVLAAFSTGG